MFRAVVLSLIVASSIALGQAPGVVSVPDNVSNVGTCNAIPMQGSFAAATSYLARIPASYFNAAQPRIDEISFAPCGNVLFSATNCQMGLGHVPNPLPLPFTYPTFDAGGNVTALGSFIDYVPIYNSVTQGAFNYNMVMDTWTPLGFAASPSGTTGFTWNGVNDVGYYLTLSGATGGGPCHRTATEPYRAYASGTYQAPASVSSGAAGLKMQFQTSNGASITPVGSGCPGTGSISPVLSTNALPSIGNIFFHVDVSQGLASANSLLYVSVGMGPVPVPIGGGCNIYLDVTSVLNLISIGLNPLGNIFLDGTGGGVFSVPIPNDQNLAGIHAGFQAIVFDPGSPNGFTLTNALEGVIN
jgi:hypothetical protein